MECLLVVDTIDKSEMIFDSNVFVRSEPAREMAGSFGSTFCIAFLIRSDRTRRKTKKLDKAQPVVHIARLGEFWTLD